ncbi:hypothetical protein CDAR_590261 [Caerostris darwini]|uniref:DNA-directed RNA polymerase n=1 Tax=Caerostris darwini TaxID=1538125 RepID=A0AAV4NNJ1_9ARAC|nr:hypothetical protein CDAR_590261 [Caerostris darwini]
MPTQQINYTSAAVWLMEPPDFLSRMPCWNRKGIMQMGLRLHVPMITSPRDWLNSKEIASLAHSYTRFNGGEQTVTDIMRHSYGFHTFGNLG